MNIQELTDEVLLEGRRLAWQVRDGEITRADLERAYEETGDGEPFAALLILDTVKELGL